MSSTAAPSQAITPAPPRLMETQVRPLNIPAEFRADSLVALVHGTVQRYPDKEALRWKLPKTRRQAGGPPEEEPVAWTSTSYRETWDWITQVAMGLKHLGIRDGDRICIMSRTRPAWLAADLGALSLGAVTCPIYPSVEPDQAAFVINNVGARLIFVENLQQAAKVEQVRATCPTLEYVVVIDDRGRLPVGAISFDDIFDLATVDPGEIREWTAGWQAFRRDRVATIVHTSGTTATPKGVVLTHGNILHNFEAGIDAIDFTEDDLFLSFLPLSHMTERAAGQIVPLGRGCTIAYAEPAIERLAANMAEVRPTVMVASTSACMRESWPRSRPVRRFACASSSGPLALVEPSTPTTSEEFPTRHGSRCSCGWRIGSSSTASRSEPGAGCATSSRAARRCRRRSASSSMQWAC
jgi:acyl-CoA synthetase (AMP-forming)/AMP-acid ligase II